MRIIGTIEHATCRIQVFQMSNKFSVKFELSMYEQTFKFRESPYLKDFNDVQRLIDAAFIAQVIAHFDTMHATADAGWQQFAQAQTLQIDNQWEDII